MNDKIRTNLAKEAMNGGSRSRGDSLPTTGKNILRNFATQNKDLLKFAPNIVK